MIGFCPLASGSKGNSLYLGTSRTKILIDAGLTVKSTRERLAEINVDLNDINAILLTHEHTDHIKGLEGLACRLGIPVFANSETAKAALSTLTEPAKFKIFSTGETFEFGDLEIHPFSIQHDTLDPVAFTIKTEGIKLGICADLGFASTLVKSALADCHYLYIEANHQPSMVHASARPHIYKQRVLGKQGHLSNDQCAELLAEIFHSDLRHVHLAHLSSECNNPDLALSIIRDRLSPLTAHLPLSIAHQDKVSNPIFF